MANHRSESYREKNDARFRANQAPGGRAARRKRRELPNGAFGHLKAERYRELAVGTRGEGKRHDD